MIKGSKAHKEKMIELIGIGGSLGYNEDRVNAARDASDEQIQKHEETYDRSVESAKADCSRDIKLFTLIGLVLIICITL
jgi:hypothetical protein